MVSKENIKWVKSLHHKKQRDLERLFIVEGEKGMKEVLTSDFRIRAIYLIENEARSILPYAAAKQLATTYITESELAYMSTRTQPDCGLLIAEMKPETVPVIDTKSITLILDGVQDPGNVGTIIRIADWYGIHTILAHAGTADVYNTKTILASMGSFTRVEVHYGDVEKILKEYELPTYGASLQGESVHTHPFPKGGFLIMGNESHGISQSLSTYVTTHITIPRIRTTESLNVAVATGIILDNWTRVRT